MSVIAFPIATARARDLDTPAVARRARMIAISYGIRSHAEAVEQRAIETLRETCSAPRAINAARALAALLADGPKGAA